MGNILQAQILTDFLYPFLLMFFISFGILEKAKIFGEQKQQLNAFISLIVALIFVGVIFPVLVVKNLILFMTIGIVVIFVGFMLWGFIKGDVKFEAKSKVLKFLAILIFISVILAVIWATDSFPWLESVLSWIFASNRSNFWTNLIIIFLVIGAVVAVIKNPVKTDK